MSRFSFSFRYAVRHFLISIFIASITAAFVFRVLYPPPFQDMLNVGIIFLLLLTVDVICGPLLTLLLMSPKKSIRERWFDLSLIGLIQVSALLYGLHAIWVSRPSVLAFEVDRLVVVTANEVASDEFSTTSIDKKRLPLWGLWHVSTRPAQNADEEFEIFSLGMSGVSPAMRPGWWLPWESGFEKMTRQARPVTDLIDRRPESAAVLRTAVKASGLPEDRLRYLPLTARKTKDWIALLDSNFNMVGYAPVDGFVPN